MLCGLKIHSVTRIFYGIERILAWFRQQLNPTDRMTKDISHKNGKMNEVEKSKRNGEKNDMY